MPQQSIPASALERMWRRVNKQSGRFWNGSECWFWTGATNDKGYGVIRIEKKNYYVHRVSAIANNLLSDEKPFALHRCDWPPCTNPVHLFAGTIEDNNLDAIHKGRSRILEFPGRTKGNARISAEDAIRIVGEYSQLPRGPRGKVLHGHLAQMRAKYGIGNTQIIDIYKGKPWLGHHISSRNNSCLLKEKAFEPEP